MCVSSCHFLNNLARAVNSTCQIQGHFDGAFNWCNKDFALLGFGVNSMGAHFNPVSVSIVNSESKEAMEAAYQATCNGLYTLYNTAVLCEDPGCGFCTQIFEQVCEDGGTKWKQHLLSDDAANCHYRLDKPSSDQIPSFFSWAKDKFGDDCQVHQCGFHLTSKFPFRYVLKHFQTLFQILFETFFETVLSIGIGWRKKTFRKHFVSEDKFTEFHKVAHRYLEAPTIKITHKLQDMIEDWLRDELEETRAAGTEIRYHASPAFY